MTGIASTTANLALWRLQWETLFSLPHLLDEPDLDDQEGCRLTEVANFGPNPGNLRMFSYVPRDLPPLAPLVVVLHGCTQTAALYDKGSGWSRLADEAGFALVFAQQRNENNPRRCFNWFRPGDFTRDRGEAASIREMVRFMTETQTIDPTRIFVTGLSAGGAMTSVMLATYPEVFSAGAIIAGLPYRAASSVHDALQAMLEGIVASPQARGDAVRQAAPQDVTAPNGGNPRWPRVAVWQGLADDTVRAVNATEIVKQWADVHGFDEGAGVEDSIAGSKRMRWRDGEGNIVIEAVAIADLGHAVPIAGRGSAHPVPYFANVGLSSTREIARFFGLLPAARAPSDAPVPPAGVKHKPNGAGVGAPAGRREPARAGASLTQAEKSQPAPQAPTVPEHTKVVADMAVAADVWRPPPVRVPEADLTKAGETRPVPIATPAPAPMPYTEALPEPATGAPEEAQKEASGDVQFSDVQSSTLQAVDLSAPPAPLHEEPDAVHPEEKGVISSQKGRGAGQTNAGKREVFTQTPAAGSWLTTRQRRKIAAVVPQIMKLLGLTVKK